MINYLIQTALADDKIKINLPGNLATVGTAGHLFNNLTNLVFAFIGFMAFVGIVYSGIMMITAGGDASKFELGKKNLLWSIIGIIIITLSMFIVRFVYIAIGGTQ